MVLRDAYETVVKLYLDGCIEVCTPDDSSAEKDRENNRSLLARTVLQPDGDVLMYVSQEILARPGIWQAHMEKIRGKIDSISRFRMFLKWIRLLSPVFLVWGGYNLWNASIKGFLLLVLPSLFVLIIKPIVGIFFQRRLKREIKRI